MDIGNKIKQLRQKANLTQEQLGDSLGISAQSVSKWENSITMPDISLLPLLSSELGVTIDELFDLTTSQKLQRIERRIDLEDAESGDLVFFRTDGKTNQTPNYMGIYLKENRFVVMSSKGLKFESMSSSYYKKNFVCAATIEE